MCISCGCCLPATDHHDPRHITAADLRAAAAAANTTVDTAAHNIESWAMHYHADTQKAETVAVYDSPEAALDALASVFDPSEYEPDGPRIVVKETEAFDDFFAELAKGEEGAVLKADDERRFLLTVVYSPHRKPLRGADKKTDLASPEVLENACWKYAMNGLGTGMWHQPGHEGEAVCVENGIYRGPDWHLTDAGGNEQVIKSGDWLAGYILSPHAWGLYKSGRIGGVSMQGDAHRKPASAEALARIGS